MRMYLFKTTRKEVFLTLLTFLFCLSTYAQTKRITGTVVDEKNEPLPGAAVKAKSGNGGASTDLNGKFSLAVPENETTLVVSFVGYSNQEVKIGSQTNLTIKLAPNARDLQEVVVIGYGTQRKEAVTGSVASVGGEKVREVPSADISRALQGRVAGVEMSQTSSKPGAPMQIRIRGVRSLNATNDPLIVLDGIPFSGSLADINPNDIKSVDILKDASATAIYGSRGANGVLMVTTNSGRRGQKAQVTYNGFQGVNEVFSKYPLMNGQEFVALRRAVGLADDQITVDESIDANTDWQDMLYKTGMTSSHNLGIAGGSEKGVYSFNVGYFRDEGVLPLQNFNRYNIRGSLDQEIGKYIRAGFVTNSNYTLNNGIGVGPGAALARSPIASIYKADGTLKPTILERTSGAQWLYTRSNLEALDDRYVDQRKSFGSYNTLYGEVKVPGIEGLKYRANLGLNYRQANGGNYTGQGVFSGNPLNPSSAGIDNELTTDWAIENLLTYDHTFGSKHTINAVTLYSAQQTLYNRSAMSARDIPADHFQFYNLGQAPSTSITVDPNQQRYQKYGLESYMGRIMYSYDDRYLLSATYRADGSSRLAKKWNYYPAISAGWNIAKESFMRGISQINSLKLRVGYGQTSNQAVDPYKTLGLLATRPYNFGDQYAVGNYVTELPNPDLGWEFSNTMNYGLDFGILNNRLSGTVEYYVQNTKDVLLGVGLPPTSGVSSITQNIGKTQNKGFELSLNGQILNDVNGWSWDAGINIYTNQNKLISLASGQERDEGNWWFVGQPINVIYDYEKIGLWQEGDPYRNILEPGGNAGMIKVKYTGDFNPDGTPVRAIGTLDRQIIKLDPKFQGGFNTRVSYKGFDLSAVAAFKKGGIINSTLYGAGGYLNTLNARAGNNVRVDYWTPENTDAKYPKPGGIQSSDNPKYGSTLGYFDASYLKIRTISLGYSFNQKFMKTVGIDRLRVYFTAQNPFVMFSPYHKESGLDPEPNSYGNENAAVAYSQNLRRILTVGTNTPSTRNYLFGVNVTF